MHRGQENHVRPAALERGDRVVEDVRRPAGVLGDLPLVHVGEAVAELVEREDLVAADGGGGFVENGHTQKPPNTVIVPEARVSILPVLEVGGQ
ncbi:hypothetical protein GCM10009804_04450 [Kribbella hippodromi]|uniref:Uncharacterized protein n=1 Tax=Kribbella hippodromi TaxID=434347 RepID=A0ABN2C6A6_9ACTN